MKDETIQNALKAAKSRLIELIRERERIDKDIVEWKRVVDSLTAVAEESCDELPPDVDLVVPPLKTTFADAVRSILAMTDDYISAPVIRDGLIEMGFDFSKYKQELVPVHNTLKRLEEQGQVQALKNEQGQTLGYKWISPLRRALTEETMYGLGTGRLNESRFKSRFTGRYKGKFGDPPVTDET